MKVPVFGACLRSFDMCPFGFSEKWFKDYTGPTRARKPVEILAEETSIGNSTLFLLPLLAKQRFKVKDECK